MRLLKNKEILLFVLFIVPVQTKQESAQNTLANEIEVAPAVLMAQVKVEKSAPLLAQYK